MHLPATVGEQQSATCTELRGALLTLSQKRLRACPHLVTGSESVYVRAHQQMKARGGPQWVHVCFTTIGSNRSCWGGGGGWHKVPDCLPLAAPIGLSPLHIPTLCGPERVLIASTEPLDDLSCLTVGWGGGGLGPENLGTKNGPIRFPPRWSLWFGGTGQGGGAAIGQVWIRHYRSSACPTAFRAGFF